MNDTARNANAFASTFLFFATHNATAEKNKKELASKRTGHSGQCDFDTTRLRTKRKAADNSTSYVKHSKVFHNFRIKISIFC